MADPEILHRWGLQPGNFAMLIAGPEPENSILEAVSAFLRRNFSSGSEVAQ